jgi:hypothetical protein
VLSPEQEQLRRFLLADVAARRMPEGYEASIARWAAALGVAPGLASGSRLRDSPLCPARRVGFRRLTFCRRVAVN